MSDLEKTQSIQADSPSSNEVNFDSPTDPTDPLQWPQWKKIATVINVSLLAAVGQMASSMIAPAVDQILEEFGTVNTELAVFVVSVFLLGMATGLLLISGLSEVYGRVGIINVTNVFFVIFAVASAVASSMGQLIGFRFLLGIASAAPPSIGGGIIGDMFVPEERGRATSMYAFGLLIGPMVGPIAGGYLAGSEGWRWTCWLVAILGGVMMVLTVFILRESYRPLILERKARRLRKETGNNDLISAIPHPGSGVQAVRRSLIRPIRLLTSSPIVLLPSLGLAVIFGMMFLMISTMAVVFQLQYGFSLGSSGLTYLGLGVGLLIGLAFFAATSDRAYKSIAAHGTPKPEIRLSPITIGAPLACAGLIVYGWGIEKNVHWMLPIVGTAIFAMAVISFIMPVTTYLIEVFRQNAAGPVGASAVLRALVGSVLPLCAGKLYDRLGLGWGNTLLAFIALIFAPLPWLFYRNGERLRTKFSTND